MRKKIVLAVQAVCVLFVWGVVMQSSLKAANIPWRTDLKAAAQESKAKNKPMLLKITADWCFYCKKMKKSFEQEKVAKHVNGCFIPVLIDADKHEKLVAAIGIDGLPTTVIITPDYKVIKKITGYKKADELERTLNKICQVNHTAAAKPRRTAPKLQSPFTQPTTPVTPPSFAEMKQVENSIPPKPTSNNKTIAQLENPFGKEHLQKEVQANQQLIEQNNPFTKEANLTAAPQAKPIPKIDLSPQVVNVKAKYAFAGLCLVSLLDERYLTEGTEIFTAKHQGLTLCFASKEYQELFQKNPEKYWPVQNGVCVVSQQDEKTKRQGDPETGAVFRNKLWFFSNTEQRQKFADSPKKYANVLQLTK